MPGSLPTRRHFPIIAAVLLSLLVVGAEVLVDPSLSSERYNDDFHQHADMGNYFPDFNHSNEVFIVDVYDHIDNETLEPGMGYTLSSLQGLVNRESAQILIDYEGWLKGEEHLDYWDFFMDVYVPYYNLTITVINHTTFIDMFYGYAVGIVVYDEDNEHTINVACTMAGINDWVVAERTTAAWLVENTDLEIEEDLHSGWGGSRADVYERSFDKLYPDCNDQMLFASIPSEWGTDYLVSCQGFVFSLNPGPFTTPSEKSLMIKIMEETPADIPVLGWFEQPTGIEENYMIQLASRNGKIFLGGFRFPNKSFFTAFEPPDDLSNPIRSEYYDDSAKGTGYPDIDPFPNTTLPLPPDTGNKIYIALAVTDGDNLGFMTRKMRKEMWNSEMRGTIPIAWSVNPLLKEIIPCLLDYYYSTPTENDTFVAGPSGIGYFNPDFASEEQLDIWLNRTAHGMEALDLRHVWLLNSFTTYETYYSERVLSAYTRELWPEGIMLDYGDVPEGRKMWMQEGDDGDDYWINPSTPVIRSMHIWGDTENFVGKLIVESQVTPDDQPIFAFAPIMSADLTLESIADLLDDLGKSDWALGRDVEFVSIDDLFYLMERHFVERARMEQGEEGGTGIIDSLSDELLLDNSRSDYFGMGQIRKRTIDERVTDNSSLENLTKLRHLSAFNGYNAIESKKQGENEGVILLWMCILLIVLSNGLFLLPYTNSQIRSIFPRKRSPSNLPPLHKVIQQRLGETGDGKILYSGLLLVTTMLIFFMSSLHVLYLNFWHYAFFGVGIAMVFVIPYIGHRLDRRWRGKKSTAGDNGKQRICGQKMILAAYLGLFLIVLPFNSIAYSFIPILCVGMFRRAGNVLKEHTLHWILLSFLLVVLFSQFLREYSFSVVSIVLIWFVAGIVGIIDLSRIEKKEISSMLSSDSKDNDCTPASHNIPAPLFTALLLTLFIVIIDIPYNRYLSMATEYRMDLLPWLLLWVPLYSAFIGTFIVRIIRNKGKEEKTVSISTFGLVLCSGLLFIQPFVSHNPIVVPLILILFGTTLVIGILGLASGRGTWKWTGRGKRLTEWVEPRFFEVLVILLILGLVIVTMPPIAFTVYVMSVPIFLAYIMYSLPAVLLIISAVLWVLSRQITLQSKPLLEP